MRYAIALIVLAQTGCSTTPPMPVLPEIVKVPVREYVAIPAELTKDCQQFTAQEQSYDEAKRLALVRAESIDECNRRWAKVRALQPKAKP